MGSATDDRAAVLPRTLRQLARVRELWRRGSRSLADMLPKGLYKRSLLIVILPMVLLQTAVTFAFMQHHWELVARRPLRGGEARRRRADGGPL